MKKWSTQKSNFLYLWKNILLHQCQNPNALPVKNDFYDEYILGVQLYIPFISYVSNQCCQRFSHRMCTLSDWWVQVPKTQHFWYSNKSTMKDALWKLPKTRGQPEILGTRTREMVPKPNFCYPNPSLWRLVYHSKFWIVI